MSTPEDGSSAAPSVDSADFYADSYAEHELEIRNRINDSSDLHESLLDKKSSCTWILTVAAVLVLTVAVFFAAYPQHETDASRKKGQETSNDDASDSGAQFSTSSSYLRGIPDVLRGSSTYMNDGWSGDSATCRANQNTIFGNITDQMADIGDKVATIVSTQNKQVEDGKKNLGNVLNELDLAIPISEFLYHSGAVGPIISWNFQILTANYAVDTSGDTARKTHLNAQENAGQLSLLAQEYTWIAKHQDPHYLG